MKELTVNLIDLVVLLGLRNPVLRLPQPATTRWADSQPSSKAGDVVLVGRQLNFIRPGPFSGNINVRNSGPDSGLGVSYYPRTSPIGFSNDDMLDDQVILSSRTSFSPLRVSVRRCFDAQDPLSLREPIVVTIPPISPVRLLRFSSVLPKNHHPWVSCRRLPRQSTRSS